MPQFMSVEVSGDMVADLMGEDPNFALEVWQIFAERIQAGVMRDDAADLASGLDAGRASFIAGSLEDLALAMRQGFNMASVGPQI